MLEIEKDTYWTFERDDMVFDADFKSRQEAQNAADEDYQEECLDLLDCKNGETASAEINLIEYIYDDEGERVKKQKVLSSVDFEYYHGDLKEHGTLYSGEGGVL